MGIDLGNVIGARRVRTPAPLYRTPNSGTLLHSAESAVETPQHAEQVSGPDFFAPEDSVLTGSELDSAFLDIDDEFEAGQRAKADYSEIKRIVEEASELSEKRLGEAFGWSKDWAKFTT